MKVFRLDVKVVATAYIVAADEQEARKLAESELVNTGTELLEEGEGGFVRGCDFETLVQEVLDDEFAPRVTISPAITIEAPFNIDNIEVADD